MVIAYYWVSPYCIPYVYLFMQFKSQQREENTYDEKKGRKLLLKGSSKIVCPIIFYCWLQKKDTGVKTLISMFLCTECKGETK